MGIPGQKPYRAIDSNIVIVAVRIMAVARAEAVISFWKKASTDCPKTFKDISFLSLFGYMASSCPIRQFCDRYLACDPISDIATFVEHHI